MKRIFIFLMALLAPVVGTAAATGASGVIVSNMVDLLVPGTLEVGSGTNNPGSIALSVTNSTVAVTLGADPAQAADATLQLGSGPGVWVSGTPAGGVELVSRVSLGMTQTGTHASPSTTNPLSPTWTGAAHIVWYGVAGTINLPPAAGYAGRALGVYNTGSFTITIDSNGTEVIVRDGTPQTGGVNFTLSSGAGNFVWLISDGVRWITMGKNGTLTLGT